MSQFYFEGGNLEQANIPICIKRADVNPYNKATYNFMSLRRSYIVLQLNSLSLKKRDEKKITVVIKTKKIFQRIPVLRIFSKIVIFYHFLEISFHVLKIKEKLLLMQLLNKV